MNNIMNNMLYNIAMCVALSAIALRPYELQAMSIAAVLGAESESVPLEFVNITEAIGRVKTVQHEPSSPTIWKGFDKDGAIVLEIHIDDMQHHRSGDMSRWYNIWLSNAQGDQKYLSSLTAPGKSAAAHLLSGMQALAKNGEGRA